MSNQVSLPALGQWYEDNIARTPTLAILRCLFQGNFPLEPVSCMTSVGKKWDRFEQLRSELGDSEFHIYLQCQMEAFKADRPGKKFYPSYCTDKRSHERYLAGREKIRHSGYHSFRSEIYRSVYPNECDALREYFRRWLTYKGIGEEPNWWNLKAALAPRGHPYWTYFSCTFQEAQDRGEEFLAIWLAGKKRLLSRGLLPEAREYDRACIDALSFIAQQTSPLARNFILCPLEEISLAYQTAVQFHAKRHEILSSAPPLKITVEGAAA